MTMKVSYKGVKNDIPAKLKQKLDASAREVIGTGGWAGRKAGPT